MNDRPFLLALLPLTFAACASAPETKPMEALPTTAPTATDAEEPALGQPADSLYAAAVTDGDGNRYRVVRVGAQVWMAENLNTGRFRNGDLIPEARSAEEWERALERHEPAWSHYDNDPANGAWYGKLYNWYAVEDARGLCPTGWQVPTDRQWKQLATHLGVPRAEADERGWRGVSVGGKLKSTRTAPDPHPRWDHPNTGATNESGFSALPSGYRVRDGEFLQRGHESTFWSSTEERGLKALDHIHAPPLAQDTGVVARWGRSLWSSRAEFYRNYTRDHGFSIRCIQEIAPARPPLLAR